MGQSWTIGALERSRKGNRSPRPEPKRHRRWLRLDLQADGWEHRERAATFSSGAAAQCCPEDRPHLQAVKSARLRLIVVAKYVCGLLLARAAEQLPSNGRQRARQTDCPGLAHAASRIKPASSINPATNARTARPKELSPACANEKLFCANSLG